MGEGVNTINEMGRWFTVNEVSKKTSILVETVRKYARRYGDYLYIKRGEKRAYLIHESSVETVKKIRCLLEQGLQNEQLIDVLEETEVITVQTDDDQMNEYMMNLPQLHREMVKELQKQSDILGQVGEQMNTYEKVLEEQQKYITDRIATTGR